MSAGSPSWGRKRSLLPQAASEARTARRTSRVLVASLAPFVLLVRSNLEAVAFDGRETVGRGTQPIFPFRFDLEICENRDTGLGVVVDITLQFSAMVADELKSNLNDFIRH